MTPVFTVDVFDSRPVNTGREHGRLSTLPVNTGSVYRALQPQF